ARDDDQNREHEHEEALLKSDLDDAMDHGAVCEALLLVLQGILELQEQAAIADEVFAVFEAGGDLRAAFAAAAESDEAASELVCAGLHVDEGLVFGVAKDGGIGNSDGVGDGAGVDESGDKHVALQFFTGILRDDAGLQGARSGIESGGDVRNFSVKEFGI